MEMVISEKRCKFKILELSMLLSSNHYSHIWQIYVFFLYYG